MFIRTYLRTLINDIVKNNFIVNLIIKIVNFYKDLWFKTPDSVKFKSNMSMKGMDKKKIIFFQSVTGDKIDCK